MQSQQAVPENHQAPFVTFCKLSCVFLAVLKNNSDICNINYLIPKHYEKEIYGNGCIHAVCSTSFQRMFF